MKFNIPKPMGQLFIRGDWFVIERAMMKISLLPNQITEESMQDAWRLIVLMRVGIISQKYGLAANSPKTIEFKGSSTPLLETGVLQGEITRKKVSDGGTVPSPTSASGYAAFSEIFVGVPTDAGMHPISPAGVLFAEKYGLPPPTAQRTVDIALWSVTGVGGPKRNFVRGPFLEWLVEYFEKIGDRIIYELSWL